jgi:chromosomal replication initiation ATPase DnaA
MTPMNITPNAIWWYVTDRCHEMGLGHRAVRGPCKERQLVTARAIIAQELRLAPWEMSLPAIGKALGNRHHTTILHLLRGGNRKGASLR